MSKCDNIIIIIVRRQQGDRCRGSTAWFFTPPRSSALLCVTPAAKARNAKSGDEIRSRVKLYPLSQPLLVLTAELRGSFFDHEGVSRAHTQRYVILHRGAGRTTISFCFCLFSFHLKVRGPLLQNRSRSINHAYAYGMHISTIFSKGGVRETLQLKNCSERHPVVWRRLSSRGGPSLRASMCSNSDNKQTYPVQPYSI